MKLRKILSSVIAGAMALSAMTFSASAEAKTVLDFEDGLMTGISMKTDDGGDKSVLSVVDYNGSKQLKVDIQKANRIPKVFFDVGAIVGYNNMEKVAKFTCDLTIQSAVVLDDSDPENILYDVPSWQGGAVGSQDGAGGALGWGQDAWTAEEYNNSSITITVERNLNGSTFTNGTEGSHILLMKWASEASDVDMYIDNVKFLDADGNALEIYPAEDAAEEEATEEEATEEEATEEEATEEEVADEEVAEEEVEEEATEEETEEDAAEEEVEEDVAEEETTEEEVVEEEDEAPATGDVDASTDSSKGSPDTGVEDVAVVAGLAIVAAGAVLVSKKRK